MRKYKEELKRFLWILLFFSLLVIISAIIADYAPEKGSANYTIEDPIINISNQNDCQILAFIEGSVPVVDCYADVFYNRAKELNRSGMYCYFTANGTFITRCKW